MAKYRSALPQLGGDFFMTDGGLETTLIFLEGQDLPEFAAFLLDAQYAQGVVAAERVRLGVEEHLFAANRRGSAELEDRSLRITISVGVAAYPDDAQDPIQLVELADTALYRAKRDGRNRVCAYNHVPAEDEEQAQLPPRQE